VGESMGERRGNEEAAGDSTVAQALGLKGPDLVAGDPRSRPTSCVAGASCTLRRRDAVVIAGKRGGNH
jgi:hypothetical protein